MKKILLATLDFFPKSGGVGQYLHGVANFFNKDIVVIAPPHRDSSEFDSKRNFKIYRKSFLFSTPFYLPLPLGGGGLRWGKAALSIRKIYRKEGAEILAVNDVLPLGYAALVLKWFFKIPYFVFLHGLDFNLAKRNWWKRFWLKRILKNAEFAVCNSRYLEDEVKKLDSKLETLVSYPTSQLPPLKLRGGEGGLSQKKAKIIFSLGRLIKRKGFDNLILAFDKIQKEVQDSLLIIAGKGPEEEFLKNLAKKSSCAQNIIFLGVISDEEKWRRFELCDIFALPTREINGDIEGFGIVYLEAAYFGKPSIAGRVGGVPEAVLDGETGILVNGENVDEIAKALIKLLKDDGLRREMGRKAKERVVEEFGASNQISKIPINRRSSTPISVEGQAKNINIQK